MTEPGGQVGLIDRLVELLRVDYDATLRALQGFVQTSGQIRAAGIAVWGVVVSLALRDRSWELASLSAAVTVGFAYADAYHAVLYRRSFRRAIELEVLLDACLDRFGKDAEDEEAEVRLLARLESHQFGFNRSVTRVRAKDMLGARPYAVFRVLYPLLVISACIALVIYAV